MNKFKLRAGNRCQLPIVSCPLTANRQPTTVKPRRYFYPSLEDLPYVDNFNCLQSEKISKRILCLPLFTELKEEQLTLITNLINK